MLKRFKLGFLITAIGVPVLTLLYFKIIDYFSASVGSSTIGCTPDQGYNSCYWSNLMAGLAAAFVLALGTIFILRLRLHKKGNLSEYYLGTAYLFLVFPLNFTLINTVYTAFHLYSVARGEFNDFFIPFMIVLNLLVLGLMSVNFSKANKKHGKKA